MPSASRKIRENIPIKTQYGFKPKRSIGYAIKHFVKPKRIEHFINFLYVWKLIRNEKKKNFNFTLEHTNS